MAMNMTTITDREIARVESPYDLLEAENIEEVHRIMAPCRNCGELRPRDDFSMCINGICHLCRINPEARRRDTARILAQWEELDDAAFNDEDEDEEEGDEETKNDHERQQE